jgi:cytosine/uracil/thiamine/allantoin permease
LLRESAFFYVAFGFLTCGKRNAPDFASRAQTPGAALWPQIFSVPLSFPIVSFIGIIVSSSSETIYGEAIWSPIDLLGRFLDDSPSSATRFGVWFIAFAFIIAQVRSRLSFCAHPFIHFCFITAGNQHFSQLD